MATKKKLLEAAAGSAGDVLEEVVLGAVNLSATDRTRNYRPNGNNYMIADSDGNCYSSHFGQATDKSSVVTKWNDSMTKQWQAELDNFLYIEKLVLSSDESRLFVIGGYDTDNDYDLNAAVVVELDPSDGSHVNGITFNTGTSDPEGMWHVTGCLDESDNVIIAHMDETDGTGVGCIAKVDTSGATWSISSSKRGSSKNLPVDIVRSGSDFVVLSANFDNNANDDIFITKYSSSFSATEVQASTVDSRNYKAFNPFGPQDFMTAGDSVDVDASGNIYALSGYYGAREIVVSKYNSSLSLQDAYSFRISDSDYQDSIQPLGLKVGKSGNIYILSRLTMLDSFTIIYLTKLDSSFSEVWRRTIQTTSVYSRIRDARPNITLAPNENSIVLSFEASGQQVVGRFPINGDGVGAYDCFIYGDEDYCFGAAFNKTDASSNTSVSSTTNTQGSLSYNSSSYASSNVSAYTTLTTRTVSAAGFGTDTTIKLVGVFGSAYDAYSNSVNYPIIPDGIQDDDYIFIFTPASSYPGRAAPNYAVNELSFKFNPIGDFYGADDYRVRARGWFDKKDSDTTTDHIEISASGDSFNAKLLVGIVLRGVNTGTNAYNVSKIENSTTNTSVPPTQSITPTTDGSVIIANVSCVNTQTSSNNTTYDYANALFIDSSQDFDVFFTLTSERVADNTSGIGLKIWNTGDGQFTTPTLSLNFADSSSMAAGSLTYRVEPA